MSISIRLLRTHYPHWGAYAGVHQFVRYLDAQLVTAETHCHRDGNTGRQWPFGFLSQKPSGRGNPKGSQWYGLSDFLAELKSVPGCLLNTTQIVHYLDGEHTVQYLPALLRRFPLSKTKTVATFHQPARMLETLINPAHIDNLNHVTVVSPCQADYFHQFLAADRISVILHGIDTEFFKPAKLARKSDAFRLVTVGHWLRDWKAIGEVAMLLRTEADVEFHIVTNRDTQMPAVENVIYHRNISDKGLLSLYQQCDALFLPLIDSTANNSLLEGIACGLPVISTRMQSVSAYLPQNEALLFDGNPPDELADAIMYLKSNPDVRANMARQARQRAKQLSWQKIAREFEAVYTMLQPAS